MSLFARGIRRWHIPCTSMCGTCRLRYESIAGLSRVCRGFGNREEKFCYGKKETVFRQWGEGVTLPVVD